MLVSIIVTNYNYEAFLSEAIDSALAQTHDELEVIVIDDGSTDGSVDIIKRYGDRVKSIFKPNTGQMDTSNIAFGHSSGDVVIFLDADDLLFATAVERHLAVFRDPEVIVSHGYLEAASADMAPVGRRIPLQLDRGGDYLERFLDYGPRAYSGSFTSGGAWARRFLEQVLPMPSENLGIVGPDGYLSTIAPLFGRVGLVDENVGRYRIHGSNRGPLGYSFTAGYFKARVAAYQACVGFANDWARRKGYSVDPGEWMDRAGWKLLLSAHAAHLLDDEAPGVPLSQLIMSPMRDAAARPLHKRWAYMLMLAVLRCSPRSAALQMTKRLFERRAVRVTV